MKGKALRKQSLHEKIAASVLLKMFKFKGTMTNWHGLRLPEQMYTKHRGRLLLI